MNTYRHWKNTDLQAYRRLLVDIRALWLRFRKEQPSAAALIEKHPIPTSLTEIEQVEQELEQRGTITPPTKLTAKQQAILRFLRNYQVEHGDGRAPSIAEIKSALEISSPSVVQYHIDRLIENGWISRQKGASRSIRMLRPFHD